MRERFRDRLQREFEQRREKNPRYSLRAYAVLLGADHSTLSQVLRGQRRVPLGRLRAWAKKLGLDAEEMAAYAAAEHLPDALTLARDSQLLHWTAEAMAVVTEPTHWEIFRLCREPDFPSDSRGVARRIGATVDEVNVALARLLRLRLLETDGQGKWRDAAGRLVQNSREFRKLALARVRARFPDARPKKETETNDKPRTTISNRLERSR